MQICMEFPRKTGCTVLSTIANPKAGSIRARTRGSREGFAYSHPDTIFRCEGPGVGMATINRSDLPEAFTFDDVLLKPGLSDVLPSDVDIRSRITR